MTLFLLLAAHALCDYPLQGDFLARGKNHRNPLPGVPWYQCLAAHALIHGGAVALITGSVWLGVAETIAHAAIDYGKSEGAYGFNYDQYLHFLCKVLWWGIWARYIRPF
jgi:hypothetical protein